MEIPYEIAERYERALMEESEARAAYTFARRRRATRNGVRVAAQRMARAISAVALIETEIEQQGEQNMEASKA